MKYRKKPVIVEAEQWFAPGETLGGVVKTSRFVVGLCKHCGGYLRYHGWIDTLEGEHIVCPGDWVITGVQGEHYPCKPDIFATTYDGVAE